MSTNHFITVSKRGELMARRKGQPPVKVATAAEGLRVATDDPALTVVVHFDHGGGNRQLCVTTVQRAGETLSVQGYQARFQVSDEALGRWIRAAVDAALDAAEIQRSTANRQ